MNLVKSENIPTYSNNEHGLSDDQIIKLANDIAKNRLAQGQLMTSSTASSKYIQTLLMHDTIEKFGIMLLNNQNIVITTKTLFTGSISSCHVYPREIIKAIIQHNAASIIIFHNHPSGITEPSNADKEITRKINDAVQLIDCTLLDHIVVSANDITSFAESGLL